MHACGSLTETAGRRNISGVRWMAGLMVACVLPCCGGQIARDGTQPEDAGPSPTQDGSVQGDVAAVPACSVVCANAHGACPTDCEARCAAYVTSDPCGAERTNLWACAAEQGKAYCTGGDSLYVTLPNLDPGECGAEADAAKACACAAGGLLCTD